MHWGTFIPAFALFVVIGLLMPVILAGVAANGRTHD